MNAEREFNPLRLRIARHRRGWTKAALASEADIAIRSVTAYESGETTPLPEAVRSLSRTLGFPDRFFFMPDIELPSAYAISFRALTTMSAPERDAAIAAGAIAFELTRWIETRFNLPPCDIPDMRGFPPEEAAAALRQRWNLGEQPIRNAIHLLEAHGVRVFSLAEDCRELDAYSLWKGAEPYVFLNTMKNGERSRHDAMHELGHLTLHRHAGTAHGRRAESEADAFSSAMLLPPSDVLARTPRYATLQDLVRLKKRWMVSVASLAHRMHHLKLLSDWHYRSICIDLGARGRDDEPNSIPRETSQVLRKVFDLARADGITRADVANELAIDLKELESLIFGLVMTGVDGGRRTRSTPNRGAVQLQLVK